MNPLFLLMFLTACSSSPPPAPPPGTATASPEATASVAIAPLAEVSVTDVNAMPVADRVLIDVRTAEEYAGGHAVGAINIPLDQLDARLPELEAHRDVEVYAICQSGGRSARATTLLSSEGFKVHNVVGGTAAWISAGLPTE